MSQVLDVLNPLFDIQKNMLIEASAGTGKTFSIENMYVRLLLEGSGIEVEKILVVTFTKAATLELKERIQSKIYESLRSLLHKEDSAPEYIQSYFVESLRKPSIRRLQRALLHFDEAQIFTIHSFCKNVLNEFPFDIDISCDFGGEGEELSDFELETIIGDHLRHSIQRSRLSKEQLQRVLGAFSSDENKFVNALKSALKKGLPVARHASFDALCNSFISAMDHLGKRYSSSGILQEFATYQSEYKALKGINKEALKQMIEEFALLFDKESWSCDDFDLLIRDGLVYCEFFLTQNLKKKPKEENTSEFLNDLRRLLMPCVNQARDPSAIFAWIAYEVQQSVEKYVKEHEKFRFDDLLHTMQRAASKESIVKLVRDRFSVAIIDEFQDTDPVQWDIFKRLFLDHGKLYLVGDPKQAIYAFRQADIYTYLDAAKELGDEAHRTLTTNFRSEEGLVDALNDLFSNDRVPNLVHLPLTNETIPIPHVSASGKIDVRAFNDSKRSVHFSFFKEAIGRGRQWPTAACEEEVLFPHLLEEIQTLKRRDGVPYSDWAVLVRDRFQAQAFADYCKRWNVPVITQRNASLVDTEGFELIEVLVNALNQLSDRSLLKQLLSTRLFRWDVVKLQSLEQPSILAEVLEFFHLLKDVLYESGFAVCFETLLDQIFPGDDLSLRECLVDDEEGIQLYDQLLQVADKIADFQSRQELLPEATIRFLEDLKKHPSDEASLKVLQDDSLDAVKVMTIHVSKGLEFPIVYALGLAKRTPSKPGRPREWLIPSVVDGDKCLVSSGGEHKEAYEMFCKELDAEKGRQLYVAMTRAKHRLYVPFVLQTDLPAKIEPGAAAPIELYLAHLTNSGRAVDEALLQPNLEPLIALIEEHQNMSYEWLDSHAPVLHQDEVSTEKKLLPPEKLVIPGERSFVSSFSSVSLPSEHKVIEAPRDFHAAVKTPHTLPAGKDTGLLLHSILETLPFEEAKRAKSPYELQPWIADPIKGSRLEEWEGVIAEVVFNALKMPIHCGDQVFSISDVSDQQCFREIDFLSKQRDHQLQKIYGIDRTVDYFVGVVDLFFSYKGKYYLLDWKSNWLGPTDEDYCYEKLDQAMKDHQYYLQADIYRDAIKRYLKLVDPRPFDECFGGAIYLFLRGGLIQI